MINFFDFPADRTFSKKIFELQVERNFPRFVMFGMENCSAPKAKVSLENIHIWTGNMEKFSMEWTNFPSNEKMAIRLFQE